MKIELTYTSALNAAKNTVWAEQYDGNMGSASKARTSEQLRDEVDCVGVELWIDCILFVYSSLRYGIDDVIKMSL
jgi:hypothetical protein